MDMTLIAFCILFVCKVSVGLKGRRETMRRTSRRTFKLEQRPERPWAISWLPDLQVRAHDKAQLRCVPASVFSFPFSCFASGVGKRTQPENNRPYLFACCGLVVYVVEIPRTFSAKQSPSKLIILKGRFKKYRPRRHCLGSSAWFVMSIGFKASKVYTVYSRSDKRK